MLYAVFTASGKMCYIPTIEPFILAIHTLYIILINTFLKKIIFAGDV